MKSKGFQDTEGRPVSLCEFYCRRHELGTEKFVDHFLGHVLHPNAAVVYPLARKLVPDFDQDDRDLVADLGDCVTLADVRRTLGRLPYYYERWRRLRLKFRLRVSSRRVMERISELQTFAAVRPSGGG